MTNRAALHSRVSTRRQEKEGTVEAQTEATKEYAEGRDWEIIGSFSDLAVSGGKRWRQRPEASKLLKLVESGDVDVIVMTKLDRFARSVVGGLEDFARLRELGVGMVFLNLGVEGVDGGNDTLDTTTSTGELMFTMLLAFAQFERRLITERMDDGRRLKVAKNRNAAA